MLFFSSGRALARGILVTGLITGSGVSSPGSARLGDAFEPDNVVFSASVINDDDSVITPIGTGSWSQKHTLHVAGDEDWVIIRLNALGGSGSIAINSSYVLDVIESPSTGIPQVLALNVQVFDQSRLFDSSAPPVQEFNRCPRLPPPEVGIPVNGVSVFLQSDELALVRIKNCLFEDRPDAQYSIVVELLGQAVPSDPGLISGQVLDQASMTPVPFIFVVTNFSSATFSAPGTGEYQISETINDGGDPLILSIISDIYEADDINLGVLTSNSVIEQDILVRMKGSMQDPIFADGFE